MAITIEIRNHKSEIGLSNIRHSTSDSRGFTLLIAAIFMSVMLTFGIALSSLGYKQAVLASLAIESQYAFYAANSALECALYADRQQGLFTATEPPSSAPDISCDGSPTPLSSSVIVVSSDPESYRWIIQERLSLDKSASFPLGAHCADVVVYKSPPGGAQTYVFSQGYNVPCATVESPGGARFVSRGLSTHY